MKLTMPRWVLAAALVLLPFGAVGPNAALGALAVLVFAIGASLLWRPGEPPILLFVFAFQWLQASIGIFHGNILGWPVADYAQHAGAHERAVLLLQFGILLLALGMRLGAGQRVPYLAVRARDLTASQPVALWLALYAAAWVASTAIEVAAGGSGGLRQVLLSLSGLKWGAFVLLTVATFAAPNRPTWPWLLVFALEFLLSLGGFFSSFKDVAFFALLGLMFSGVRLRVRQLLLMAALVPGLVAVALAWTAVKVDFRDYLNQGTSDQVVLVGYTDAVTELGRMVAELEPVDYVDAVDQLLARISYFEYFGVVLDQVPSMLPHARGELWGEAALRPFMPRLLFPDKRAINDSELTVHYTGLNLAGAEEGTSISMGFMAEAYIDFGPLGMFFPIFALGLVLGGLYRWLVRRPGPEAVFGSAIAIVALMKAQFLETSILKLLPSLVLAMIVSWLLMTFVVPWLLSRRVQSLTVSAGRETIAARR